MAPLAFVFFSLNAIFATFGGLSPFVLFHALIFVGIRIPFVTHCGPHIPAREDAPSRNDEALQGQEAKTEKGVSIVVAVCAIQDASITLVCKCEIDGRFWGTLQLDLANQVECMSTCWF